MADGHVRSRAYENPITVIMADGHVRSRAYENPSIPAFFNRY